MLPENFIYEQRFAFIPHKLDIEGKPELCDFPYNVLYISYKRVRGIDISGTAIYEPEIESYRIHKTAKVLDYKNIYGPGNLLIISRFKDSWEGRKVINDKEVLIATGGNWKQFFVQLTMLGLSKGERCKYEPLSPRTLRN